MKSIMTVIVCLLMASPVLASSVTSVPEAKLVTGKKVTADVKTKPVVNKQLIKDDCPPCNKPKKKKRKPSPNKPKQCSECTPTVVLVCPQGPVGPAGPQGAKGDRGVTQYASLYPGVGYMAVGLWPKKDYAWAQGVSLRFESILNADNTMLVQIGFAPGRDGAVMGQVAIRHWFDNTFLGFDSALSFGLFGQVIGLNDNRENGYYAGFTPQLVLSRNIFSNFILSVEAGPVLGLAKYETTDTDVVGGVLGGAGLSWEW